MQLAVVNGSKRGHMLLQQLVFGIGIITLVLVATLFLAENNHVTHPSSNSRSMKRIQDRTISEKDLGKNEYFAYDSSAAKTKQAIVPKNVADHKSGSLRTASEESFASLVEGIYDDPFEAMRRLQFKKSKKQKGKTVSRSTKAPSEGRGVRPVFEKSSKAKGGSSSRAPSSSGPLSTKYSKKKALKGKGKGKGRAPIGIQFTA